VNVNGFNPPVAVNVHDVGDEIMLAEVGLEIPKPPETQPEIVPTSAGAKPVPDTVTTVPIGPEVGPRVIVGPLTVNVACATSPAGSPLIWMMYGPAGTVPTVNVKASRAPAAVKVQEAAAVIIVVEDGLESPKSGAL